MRSRQFSYWAIVLWANVEGAIAFIHFLFSFISFVDCDDTGSSVCAACAVCVLCACGSHPANQMNKLVQERKKNNNNEKKKLSNQGINDCSGVLIISNLDVEIPFNRMIRGWKRVR